MMLDEEGGEPAVPLEDLKTYLRITGTQEDGLLARLLASATGLCEQFTGQWLVVRQAREVVAARAEWQRLTARPVVAVSAVEGWSEAGVASVLPVEGYAVDIDASGEAWVRVHAPGVARVRVTYSAGLAGDMTMVPAGLGQGIVRLAADHYATREGGEVKPPAAVTALWRPWRRMRLL
ncbi:head-tail connector protein [Sphingobium aromaticiconvertens]|uniref:head-tail connector protein n=1 Tax=Sphingobium aromaticiconvertens TaxID=365341 RepID=UPI003019CCE5